jgi:DNA ligase 1
MRPFTRLFAALDETTKTSAKVSSLAAYFAEAPPPDAAWAVYFLSGRRLRGMPRAAAFRQWAGEEAALPDWLVEESYHATGDLSEAVALLLPEPEEGAAPDRPLRWWVEEVLLALPGLDEAGQREVVTAAWRDLPTAERFVFNKLMRGSFRVGVSQRLLTRALAEATGVEVAALAHRLMGEWDPTPDFFSALTGPETGDALPSQPYPFFLAHPLETEPEATLGGREGWVAEWKYDGVRAQLIRRGGETYVWSRGEELVTHRFPELEAASAALPEGTVLDGEIVPFREGTVGPFAQLQRRLNRKQVPRKLQEEVPVALIAFDLLELGGQDLRERSLAERRVLLAETLAGVGEGALRVSPSVEAETWEALAALREEARERGVEGLMLKGEATPYGVGRPRGPWWKWKVDPYTLDVVLTSAKRGSGRRAGLYTDYTLAVWDDGRLVPVAQAYSGLTDEELRKVDRFIRQHTMDQFGPVRTVEPRLVFEIAFEQIQRSNRHKAGLAVRFPRILRWRHDLAPKDADSLDTLARLLPDPA